MKKIISTIAIASITSLFAMPPMPPSFNSVKSEKPYPKSCSALPRMIVFLPPPMEIDFIQCKNDLNMPTILDVEKALLKKYGKGVSDTKVSLAVGFHQLYRVDYTQDKIVKTILVNGSLTKIIESSASNFN